MHNSSVVIVHGTPYEHGVQQGAFLADLIAENVRKVKTDLTQSGCDMKSYMVFVMRNTRFLQLKYPDLIDELCGISDGSGLQYEDILILNIPAYFMKQYFVQECSMIMARGCSTTDGCTYLIKNRDMKIPIQQVVVERHYNDGRIISEINGAGTLTYPANGLNNHKLAIATTGFWSKYTNVDLSDIDHSHIFVNIHLLLMNCNTVSEVISYLEDSPRMNGLNIIAADENDAAVIEMTRDDIVVSHDDGSGLLYRTNHYMSQENVALNPHFEEYPSTFLRYSRIEEMLAQRKGKVRFQDLFRIMSDHKNKPVNAICRHKSALAASQTVSTSLICLEDGEIWTTMGNPCERLVLSRI